MPEQGYKSTQEISDTMKDFLESLKKRSLPENGETPCLHMSCIECLGTGKKRDGSICIHMISCNCQKCSPQSVSM
jgi:hypothetical protein